MEVSEDVTAVTLGQAVESLHKLKLAIKDRPTVTGRDGPTITGKNGPTVTGRNGPTITAGDSSTITGRDSPTIKGRHDPSITAGDSTSITAGDSTSITAGDSTSITAGDSPSITAATVTDPAERVDFFGGVRPKRVDSRRRGPGGATSVLCPSTVESTRPLLSASPVPGVEFLNYVDERQMPEIMQLIQRDLSEPYSIYTYRYFINNWPNLCFLARCEQQRIVGAIVCKLDSTESHKRRMITNRGYIAMLAVDKQFRKRNIGSLLVRMAIKAMVTDGADEVVLETEVTNDAALRLYENLGFVRDKRLFRYYLNGVDALRLKLWLWPP